MPVLIASPAQSFDQGWGDQGKPNFIVVEWNFGNEYGERASGLGGIPAVTLKERVTLSARIRINGQEVCSESIKITSLSGQEHSICGGIAINKGGPSGGDQQIYFRAQQGPEAWLNSPAHCGGFPLSCRHYWNANW